MSKRSSIDDRYLDYYSVNEDFKEKTFENINHEIVGYHKNTSIRVWYNQQTESYPTHWHHAMEMIIPVENCYYATVNGKKYTIAEGDMLIIPPGELHSCFPPDDGGTRFCYLFDISMLDSLQSFSSINPLLTSPLYISKESHPNIYNDIYDILLKIRNEYFTDNVFSELNIYSLLLNMFVKLGSDYANSKMPFPNNQYHKQHEYIQKFNELLNYIDTHYSEPLTLDDMASQVGFSKFHFSRLFKQYTEYTFCDYLNLRRIKAAENLLLNPELTIMDIAMQVGFSSISTFNRVFKESKKCSPSEYRAKNSVYTLRR